MSRSFFLVHGILAALFVFLTPPSAGSQEKTPSIPPVQQAEQSASEQSAVAQPAEEPADPQQPPETTAAPDQGTVVIPQNQGTAVAPVVEEAAGRKSAENIYTIKPGDTLWDISNAFLRDPFLWPFLWKANPSISNADLIYPGNKLVIPGMEPIERALQAPEKEPEDRALVEKQLPQEETPGEGAVLRRARAKTPEDQEAVAEETVSMSRLIIPDSGPAPIIDKYSLLSAGYVGNDDAKDLIIGGPEGKTIYGYDDLVYVRLRSREAADIGEKFLMFQPLNKVVHPGTGTPYGRLIKILGIMELTAKNPDDTYTGRITLSFDVTSPGKTKLLPYQEPVLTYESKEKKTKDISGYIIEVTDTRTINAQIDVVYLDKGSADGVEPGDRFLIYTLPGQKKGLPRLIGETQVILVKEKTATAIVKKSTETIAKGDRIEYKK